MWLMCRHTGKWVEAYKELNEAIKELGDVRNWAKVMENGSYLKDVLFVASPTFAVRLHDSLSTPSSAFARHDDHC